MANIKKIVEALIFSSDRPLTLKQLKDIINEEKSTSGLAVDIKKLESAIRELTEQYDSDEYSYRLVEIAGGYRFATKKEYAVWLAKLNKEKLKRKQKPFRSVKDIELMKPFFRLLEIPDPSILKSLPIKKVTVSE